MERASEPRLRVLQVIGNAIIGGVESWVARLVAGLPAERFEFVCLCPFESAFTASLREAGAEVVIGTMPENPAWSTLTLGCALVRMRGIEVIHTHLPNAHLLGGLLGKLMNRPVLATLHGRSIEVSDLEAHRLMGTHLSVVCRQSHYQALGLGIPPTQVHLIPNGVESGRWRPGPDRDRSGIPGLERSAEGPLIALVARLAPEKGPDVFVRVAQVVHALRPDAGFVIAGEGPMVNALRGQITQAGLDRVVRLLGPVEDMRQVYAAVDLVVSTSHSEAMPLALMEAMASGLPVVATAVGGVPELVSSGRTGRLVPPNDVPQIAGAIVDLLSQPDRMREMGRQGHALMAREFQLEHSLSQLGDLLSKLARPERERRVAAVAPVAPSHRLKAASKSA